MAGFNAAEAVPKLDWDFTKYVKGAKGCSPEPSADALYEFNAQYRTLVEGVVQSKKAAAILESKRTGKLSEEDAEAEMRRWAAMSWEEAAAELNRQMADVAPPSEIVEVSNRQAELIAEVLQHNPSADQIKALPGRIRAAYFGWVVGQLLSPEYGAVATN